MIESPLEQCGVDHAAQLDRLNALLAHTWKNNSFYRNKWAREGVTSEELHSTAELERYPFTTRAELIADQKEHPPLGTNLSCPAQNFKRFMRSSGTTRNPVLWADTPRTWEWVTTCSAELHTISGVRERDTVLFMTHLAGASGPWVILEGARRIGCTCLTCDSNDVNEAWRWLDSMRPNVLVGKPQSLLMLDMALRSHGSNPARAGLDRVILTGEGSTIGSSARKELEACWGAPCFDRYGMTEAGSVAAECMTHDGALHVLDKEFIAEIIDPSSDEPGGAVFQPPGLGGRKAAAPDGEAGELVLTNLGRIDRPIIRYRTGDRTLFAREHHCSCGRIGTILPRGIFGRLP